MFKRIKRMFQWTKRQIHAKLSPNDDAVLNGLCQDTQIILKQFMEKVDFYGDTVYMVSDIQTFDILIRNHTFEKFDYCGGCDLDYCVNENLKSGTGFVIFMNGQEYVAIPAPRRVDADCLIKVAD